MFSYQCQIMAYFTVEPFSGFIYFFFLWTEVLYLTIKM